MTTSSSEYMPKDVFFEKFIKNNLEDVFFTLLNSIFKKQNNNLLKKQKEIEKLVNVFLLKKTEKKIIINPL